MIVNLLRAAFSASWSHIFHSSPNIEYWKKTKRQYPIIDKVKDYKFEDTKVKIPIYATVKTENKGMGCGIGGIPLIADHVTEKGQKNE